MEREKQNEGFHHPASAVRGDEASHYLGFTFQSFNMWVRRGLLPVAGSTTGSWTKAALDEAIERLTLGGYQPTDQTKQRAYVGLPNVHRIPRRLSDGRVRYHFRHRKTGDKLPSTPGSPAFMSALIAAERRLAAHQPAATAIASRIRNQPPSAAQLSRTTTLSAPKSVTQNRLRRERPPSPAERLFRNSRRRAAVTQAEIARIIRAAKQAGATEVQVRLSDSAAVVIRLEADNSVASDDQEIIL